jgi:hypothetical protein
MAQPRRRPKRISRSQVAHPHCPFCVCDKPHVSAARDSAADVAAFVADEVFAFDPTAYTPLDELVSRFRIWVCFTGRVSPAIEETVFQRALIAQWPVNIARRSSKAFVYGIKLRPFAHFRSAAESAASKASHAA